MRMMRIQTENQEREISKKRERKNVNERGRENGDERVCGLKRKGKKEKAKYFVLFRKID
jgi:hypothetical protein